MEKIKTIKEIVTTPTNKCDGIEVHFLGTIVTKKDVSRGSGKKRIERTKLLIRCGNFCLDAAIVEKTVGSNYQKFVKSAKIGGYFYFEGNIEVSCSGVRVEITNIDSNILLKKLEHVEETAEIRLLKYIVNDREAEAIKLLNDNKNININYLFSDENAVFTIINHSWHMCNLFEAIINYPNFDFYVSDGFGETLLETLIYFYGSDEISPSNKCKKSIEKMIKAYLKTSGEHFNAKDLNSDTAINIACEYPKLLWVVKALLEKKEVDINVVNDFDCAALGNAIRDNNIEAIKLLAKRHDLIVRDKDVELAKQYDVDLEALGIDISKTRTNIVNKTAERNEE